MGGTTGKCYKVVRFVSYSDIPGQLEYSEFGIIEIPCPGGGGGDGSGDGSSSGSGDGSCSGDGSGNGGSEGGATNPGSSTGGGGGSTGGSTPSGPSTFEPDPVLTNPVVTLSSFVQSLTTQQRAFWFNNTNRDVTSDLTTYLSNNGYSLQSQYFVKDLINSMINTGLTFDPVIVLVSPFNIDMTAVEGNTSQEIRFRSVYNKLTSSPLFKQLIVNLFQDNSRYHVKFKICLG